MLTKEVRLDPRVKRTRELLQKAFIELMQKEDFQSITVQDITAQAEVNRATFYAHFEDKFALLNYTAREAFLHMLEGKLPDEPTFTSATLRTLTLATCEFLAQFMGRCLPSARSGEDKLIAAQVQQYINELILDWIPQPHSGVAEHPISPETVASVTSWVILGSALQWVHDGRKISAEQVADQLVAFQSPSLSDYFEAQPKLMHE